MILEKVKSDIVAHLSYLIGSHSNAAVIGPQRYCQVYIEAPTSARFVSSATVNLESLK